MRRGSGRRAHGDTSVLRRHVPRQRHRPHPPLEGHLVHRHRDSDGHADRQPRHRRYDSHGRGLGRTQLSAVVRGRLDPAGLPGRAPRDAGGHPRADRVQPQPRLRVADQRALRVHPGPRLVPGRLGRADGGRGRRWGQRRRAGRHRVVGLRLRRRHAWRLHARLVLPRLDPRKHRRTPGAATAAAAAAVAAVDARCRGVRVQLRRPERRSADVRAWLWRPRHLELSMVLRRRAGRLRRRAREPDVPRRRVAAVPVGPGDGRPAVLRVLPDGGRRRLRRRRTRQRVRSVHVRHRLSRLRRSALVRHVARRRVGGAVP